MVRISDAERQKYFGKPGDRSQLIIVTTPWGIRVPKHRLIASLFLRACDGAARENWKPQRIDSYNPRPVRGQEDDPNAVWSLHSYGLADDFFVTPPGVIPPGGVWTPHNGVPANFARHFEALGFTWGARWKRKDVPHIEYAGYPPSVDKPVDNTTLALQEDTMYVGYNEGKASAEVQYVQRAINKWQVLHGQGGGSPLKEDGEYGPETRGRVRSIQQHLGYTATGTLDWWTWDRIREMTRGTV